MIFSNLKVLFLFLIFPLFRMDNIGTEEFLKNNKGREFLDRGERLLKAYDNPYCSFLVTNVRIIGIGRLRLKNGKELFSDIFTVPIFQIGTFRVFSFTHPPFNAVNITSSPGFKFYWFFKKSVDMDELSNIISRVAADVQGSSTIERIE